MLPVALTCPLWWVARWATRLLTSLAVAGALTLGAATAPAASAAPEAPPVTVGGRPSTPGGPLPCASVELARTAGPGTAVPPHAPADARPGVVHAQVDALPGGLPAVAAAPAPASAVAAQQRAPHAPAPAVRAPRAPPAA
ncbi:hypothetical protein [Micromonospora sp. WMMD812]|uniref:hypothetical protein n=1 Tax=Micromonospora sp. WMMD812 TaxID=3015152 RepID=UPI00248C936B|nr:hypothetical protein [Micromonospora sp. WMMD812]WBB69900.1 hypothetical protein O7603_11305 [Micromonospora sp. WMMD812]